MSEITGDEIHTSTICSQQPCELPAELWKYIFQYVLVQKDIKNLCLVSKHFYQIAHELLWYNPHLYPYNLQDFAHISKMPIHVLSTEKFRCHGYSDQFYFINTIEQFEEKKKLFKLIGTMDQLRTLRVVGRHHRLNPDVLMSLKGLKNLRSLTFKDNSYHVGFVDELLELLLHTRNVNELHMLDYQPGTLILMSALKDAHLMKFKVLTLTFIQEEGCDVVFDILHKFKQLNELNVRFMVSDGASASSVSYGNVLKTLDSFRELHPACKVKFECVPDKYSYSSESGFRSVVQPPLI